MLRWFKRIVATLVLGVFFGGLYCVARTSPDPLTADEISKLTIGLNEAAAIGVPHGFLLSKVERASHSALLSKVEAGEVLNADESKAYRAIFQNILFESQGFLSMFDAELTVLPDHALQMTNNVQSNGIVGHHDHHDRSARLNFAGLLGSLEKLDQATSAIGRIVNANAAQKDLVDLISHVGVAAHTISVAYEEPQQTWSDAALGLEFEDMLKAFKSAQFSEIHSSQYWDAIDKALQHYNALILSVQSRVQSQTSPWERRIAGRFLSFQTGAPPVDLNRPLRRK